jgi:hypothetical protein
MADKTALYIRRVNEARDAILHSVGHARFLKTTLA